MFPFDMKLIGSRERSTWRATQHACVCSCLSVSLIFMVQHQQWDQNSFSWRLMGQMQRSKSSCCMHSSHYRHLKRIIWYRYSDLAFRPPLRILPLSHMHTRSAGPLGPGSGMNPDIPLWSEQACKAVDVCAHTHTHNNPALLVLASFIRPGV